MGFVYRAVQKATGGTVALKVMKAARTAEMGVEQSQLFAREASILSQLHHPHIIRFLEMGITNGRLFVATEFVETVTLEELLSGQPFDYRVRVVCDMACQILEALDYAHRRSVVHRDIKPSNILLQRSSPKPVAKLVDFGLAKNYKDAGFSGLTLENEVRGSYGYMAPEQLANSCYAKPACDLYSLGVTLYEYLSGRLPFEGRAVLRASRATQGFSPIPLAELCPGLPHELVTVIHRALQNDPLDRFSSADEMRAALLPWSITP